MDIATVVLSGIAIVVSIVSLCLQLYYQIRMNQKNLESEYYKQIFMSYLLREIPNNRKYISFTKQGKLSIGYKRFNKVITNLRNDILYFSYRDKEFYKSLNKLLVDIDEKIVSESSKNGLNFQEQKKIIDDIDKMITKIYEMIMNNYMK